MSPILRIRAGLMRQQAAGGQAQEPVQPGHHGDLPAQFSPLGGAELTGPGDRLLQLGDELVPDGRVADGGVGVVADHEPVGVTDPDFLDLQVPGDLLVAALPGQRRLDVRGLRAELLPDDVPLNLVP